MSQQIPVNILSDSDSEPEPNRLRFPQNDAVDLTTPPPFPHSKKKMKKLRTEAPSNPNTNSTVLIIDDDPTPVKPPRHRPSPIGPTLSSSSSTPSFVAETPFSSSLIKCSSLSAEHLVVAETPLSELSKPGFSIANCNSEIKSQHATEDFQLQTATDKAACSLLYKYNATEYNGFICVESGNESDSFGGIGMRKHCETVFAERLMEMEVDFRTKSSFSLGSATHESTSIELQKRLLMDNADKMQGLDCSSGPCLSEDGISLTFARCNDTADNVEQNLNWQKNKEFDKKEERKEERPKKPKKMSKEERLRLVEERKEQKEREKLLKAALKAEAAEMKKRQKEMQKWEKGKYALKSIVAEIDRKVVELGSIGGHLLTRFAEKGLSYRITTNPVDRSIVWTMVVPEEISQTSSEPIEISYVLIIYDAEEFCNIVVNGSLMDHVQSVQHRYPHHTICYLTNRLMAYINKREQAQYKNPSGNASWKRPAIEEALATLATHFFKVHSRLCVDEAEIAEHVVGLTCSLASCQFRKKLTRLSVNANGSVIPKDCVDKNLIKKNLWLKALVAIPKVQPRFAVAIWKKYPTMKSLLRIYMDPTKSVHEKEFLLKDLTTEGLFGDDRRVGEVCSKRIYRILMAQSGNIKTDDVENGADFFTR